MPVSKLVHQIYFDNGSGVVPVTPTEQLPVTGDWLTEAQYTAAIPTEYPLPAAQLSTLTPQTDGLTDAELRASPIDTQSASEYLFSEYQASLADGTEIVTPILDMESVDKWQGEFGAGVAGLDQVIETSNDASFAEFTVTSSTPINTTFQLFNVIVRQRYLRVRWQNNTGGPVSGCYMAIKASYGSSDKLSVFPLAVSPTDFSQAALVQAVTKGQQPDGDYVNMPADGNIVHYSTPLGAAGSVTLGPFDTDGWKAMEIYIATDQPSATGGISVEYTPDTGAASPVYYPGPNFTYSPVEVITGFVVKRLPPALDGFRITYTNGGTPQGSMFMSIELKAGQTEPQSVSLENQINASFGALLARAVLGAKDDVGTYGNIMRGPLGGLRASIYEHESETPIKPLNNLSGNATSVGSSAPGTQIASAPPAGTKSVEIQADPTNTKVVYLGFASGVTSGNAPVALTAGDARVYEVEDTPQFWVISASGSQTVRWTYIAEV